MKRAPVKQYLDLYDANRSMLGERQAERRALEEAELLDPVFAPEDYGVNMGRMPLPVDVNRSMGCDVPQVTTLPAIMVNDIFAASPKLEEKLPEGVKFMSLRRAMRECPELIPPMPAGDDTAETRLNDLLWTDGVLLSVADGVQLSRPLQLTNILSAPMDLMAMRRVVISLGRNAEAQLLICDHTQDCERRYLVNELVAVTLAEGAHLTLDRVEESSPLTTVRTTLNATLDAHATLRCTTASLHSGDSVTSTNVLLLGDGSEARVNGMVIADGEERRDHSTRITHRGRHTKSNQIFKYVADGRSRCSFDGLIVVEEGALFTEAYQTNHNLLASGDATMHSEPALEIYCDEVKCNHGATTGQLDEMALFYMRSRGIPEAEARHMLMQAFVDDVIDQVHIEGLRHRLRHLVERRFTGEDESCNECSIGQNV